MNEKKVKELRIGLENCEGIVIPYGCFKRLSINNSEDLSLLKNNDEIHHMKCDIADNSTMECLFYGENDDISPIYRLGQYDDITHVDIIYEDKTTTELIVEWGEYDCNSNSNQSHNKVSYKAIHIEITPFIQTYTIQEVFELDVFNLEEGRIIYGNENKPYILMDDKDIKYLDGQTLNAEMVNMKFTLLPVQL